MFGATLSQEDASIPDEHLSVNHLAALRTEAARHLV
jgi:hypothetical protein